MEAKKNIIAVLACILLSLHAFPQGRADSIYHYLQKRDYRLVEEICREMIQVDEDNPEAWFCLGIALQGMQNYPGALDSYKKASADSLFNTAASYRMAECQEFLGDIKTALSIYTDLIERDSSDRQSMQKKGKLLLRLEEYKEASLIYSQLLQDDPENYVFNKNMGICSYKLNREAMAARYFGMAWFYNKKDMSLPVSIANAYAKLKLPDKALSALKDGLKQDSSCIPILKTAGSIVFAMGNDEEAASYFQKAYNYGDTGAFTNKYLGIAYFNLSRYEEAIPFLRRYYSYDTLNTDATYFLGHALSSWYPKEEGISFLRKTIELSYPEPAFIGSLYAGMALAKEDMNQREEAIEYYKKAMELDPSRSDYYLQTAKLYDSRGRIDNDAASSKLALEYFTLYLDIEEKKLEKTMQERNLKAEEIFSPGIRYARNRIKKIREDLFFRGELEK